MAVTDWAEMFQQRAPCAFGCGPPAARFGRACERRCRLSRRDDQAGVGPEDLTPAPGAEDAEVRHAFGRPCGKYPAAVPNPQCRRAPSTLILTRQTSFLPASVM